MADLSKDLPLTFRIAEPSDFDEIIRLSNEVFPSGNDYLQHKINKWLQMNNLAILLAFVDEKLVGLQACFIVDEGQTFVRQANAVRSRLTRQRSLAKTFASHGCLRSEELPKCSEVAFFELCLSRILVCYEDGSRVG